MKKTIGMFAHVDAGKTTFSEQLLYHTKSIKNRGRVDHKNAFLDSHDIEKSRGITVFADQAVMTYQGSEFNLIDTPGHVDFSPEMERAIQVMDAAVVIVSAVEGVEGHTETVWQLLRKHRVPTFFFINKTDRVGADVERVLEDIRLHLTADVCDITDSLGAGSISEKLAAFLAERDDALLEKYMENTIDVDGWLRAMKRMVREGKVFPCSSGSALLDIGVLDFMDKLDRLVDTEYSEQGLFSGRVYKIRHDENRGRLTFIKALSGTLQVRDELSYGTGEQRVSEKVTQIRVYNGSKSTSVERVSAGQLFAVSGLTLAAAGDGVGALEEKAVYDLIPTLKSKVLFDSARHAKDVLAVFRMLDAEDPSLQTAWDEHLQEIHIHVMGTIQLEVLQQVVKDRFGITVSFGSPEILYKETIANTVTGCGHFEPLGHYAEVHLRLEPAERGSGLTFENACHPDVLTTNFQNVIRQHLFERSHHGLLTGSPLTDLKVTLLKGRAHNKHTEGGDFREATFRALRQGLEKADDMLLEPYYDFKIKVSLDQMGRVLSDIQQAHGRFHPPETMGNQAILTGKVPTATFMNYSPELAAFTQGRGTIRLTFGGYDLCHNEAEVIQRKGYKKNADPEYSSSSIFCSKGQAFVVPWDQAESHMHV